MLDGRRVIFGLFFNEKPSDKPKIRGERKRESNEKKTSLLETNRLKIFFQQHYYVSAASQSEIYFPLPSSVAGFNQFNVNESLRGN